MNKRVLVFGDRKCGKTSVIKLITKSGLISSESGDVGKGTFSFLAFQCDGWTFVECTGFDQNFPPDEIESNKKNFEKLNAAGFSLMIFVRKSQSDITRNDLKNYRYFFEEIGRKTVPILLVLTHCDIAKPIDLWWRENKGKFLEESKMIFSNCISVCSIDEAKLPLVAAKDRQKFENRREQSGHSLTMFVLQYEDFKTVPLRQDNFQPDVIIPKDTKSEIKQAVNKRLMPELKDLHTDNFVGEKKRILVFGECGKGKSSIIKLLTNIQEIKTSNTAKGCTFECTFYDSGEYSLADTVGLNEGSQGEVSNKSAIIKLVRFVQSNKAGFNLMVWVKKKEKLTQTDENNYKLFSEVLNKDDLVPMLLVVTNCEFLDPMSQWWDENKKIFLEANRMKFKSCVCVCAADQDFINKADPVFRPILFKKATQSRTDLLNALKDNALEKPVKLYSGENWKGIVKNFLRLTAQNFGFQISKWQTSLTKWLMDLGYTETEVKEIQKEINRRH